MQQFEKFYKDFYPILYRVIYRITTNSEAAEDVCQEAFIKYHEYQDRLPGDEQNKYWIIRVAKNLAFNYEKKVVREYKAVAYLENNFKSPESEGEEAVLRKESMEWVQKALTKLPEKLRAPLILKEYGKLNYKEIGKILMISEGNVKIRIFRAREQLTKELAKEDLYVPK